MVTVSNCVRTDWLATAGTVVWCEHISSTSSGDEAKSFTMASPVLFSASEQTCCTLWVAVALPSTFWISSKMVTALFGSALCGWCTFCVRHAPVYSLTLFKAIVYGMNACMFSCNLPPAFLSEWLGAFTWYCSNRGRVEQIQKWVSTESWPWRRKFSHHSLDLLIKGLALYHWAIPGPWLMLWSNLTAPAFFNRAVSAVSVCLSLCVCVHIIIHLCVV